jgi:hypothetical protein
VLPIVDSYGLMSVRGCAGGPGSLRCLASHIPVRFKHSGIQARKWYGEQGQKQFNSLQKEFCKTLSDHTHPPANLKKTK